MKTEAQLDEWYDTEKEKLFDDFHKGLSETDPKLKKKCMTSEQYIKKLDALRARYEKDYDRYVLSVRKKRAREKKFKPLIELQKKIKNAWESLVNMYR